jgi:hypothetical protein
LAALGQIVDGLSLTHSSRLICYKADSQRMSLIGDRGKQPECRERPGRCITE